MRRRVAHVWPEAPRLDGGEVEVAATVEWPPYVPRFWKDRRQRVYVRLPAHAAVPDAAVGDAFLLGTVFCAMRRARTLVVHASVAADLLGSLSRLVALWVARRPDKYRAVELAADATTAPSAPSTGPALLCFSGGIDSAYSLWAHAGPARREGAEPVGAAVMLRGADIPVGEVDAFSRAFERSRRMTASLSVPLLEASTNLRILKQNWAHSSSATLAAVMTLLRAHHREGRIAVGFTVPEARRWWPQDETDPPLLSTAAFPVRGDGFEADRFEKMAALAAWPEALSDLRVCYRPGVWDRNCGECFKCLSVMFFARIACGRMPPFMPRDVTPRDVAVMAGAPEPNILLRFEQIRRYARARGIEADWLVEVEAILERSARSGAGAGAPS